MNSRPPHPDEEHHPYSRRPIRRPYNFFVIALSVAAVVSLLAVLVMAREDIVYPDAAKHIVTDSRPDFKPPSEDEIPENEFGAMIRRGKELFVNTQVLRGEFVGNGLTCANCHLDAGKLADSAPMWGAYVNYPAYRSKNKQVNTLAERIQGCFRYSENGAPPPADSDVIKALETYFFWMSKDAPVGVNIKGRGYPELPKPDKAPDVERGRQVFTAHCAICHGADGQGTQAEGQYVFPPLWGKDSFNWGAGMHRINTAAQFIKANMPLGQPGTLSDQQAWDVAAFINSHERPQDPRFQDSVAQTKAQYHDHQCHYGEKEHGVVLGAKSFPNPLKQK